MSELIVKFGACFKNEQEMTADMTILEAIGIGVGAVATVLAGVWFIVNKAFGVGRFSHRMEEVDKRTSHAACDMHERAIGDIKDDIRIVKADVESIKSLLVMKLNDICLHEGLEGGFLTKKEVDEIAARISKGVYDRVLKQLEDSTPVAEQPGPPAGRGGETGQAQ